VSASISWLELWKCHALSQPIHNLGSDGPLDIFYLYQGYLDCVLEELTNEYGVKAEVRQFDWDAHPKWMRINESVGYFGGTGEYAWKAVMIHTVLRERGLVLWADAGNRFLSPDGDSEEVKN
jgi:hypothetical protein